MDTEQAQAADTNVIVFGSPGRYVQGRRLIEQIGTELARLGSSAIVVIDPVVRQILGDKLARSCADAHVSLLTVDFGGESSAEEIDRLEREIGTVRPSAVVAVGGGKCMDTGKALGARLKARIVTVPTIASNDSATSHIYVLYDAQHRLLSVEKLDRNPDLVLVDIDVIAHAPARLLTAGIGDALVKKYEIEQCVKVHGRNVFGSHPSLAALAMARGCYDILRADAMSALAAINAQKPNAALERIVEACVLMSGLSFESGGLSIAHAMTRGLSAVKPIAGSLHGFQVAYGVTVQLMLEGRDETFMADHAGFCTGVGLPLSLGELGAPDPTFDQLETIADLTLAAPHMQNFERQVTRNEFIDTMQRLETMYGSMR